MKLYCIAVAAIVVTSTPAFAEDDKPFTGPWVGLTAGYDAIGSGTEDEGDTKDGIAYGIAAGYDFDLGGIIAGIEAELAESSVSASGSNVLVTGDTLKLSAGRDIYVGARLGVAVTDSILLYAKAGYSNLQFKATYSLDDETSKERSDTNGFRVGAGAEFDFDGPFARIEYRYSDYGAWSDTELETDRHQVMLTAGLRF